jgi:M6 family metalloprotease-like protein
MNTIILSSCRKPWCRCSILVLLIWFAGVSRPGFAAPFAGKMSFSQPDGTPIELWGRGDEFHAEIETLDGYTVVFIPEARAYYYAQLSSVGDELVPTALEVGKGDPGALSLAKHLRISAEAAATQSRQRREEWDARLSITARWSKLKRALQRAKDPLPSLLRYGPTIGLKRGLTILIDFDDTPRTVTREAIVEFLNGDNYRGNGNNGSVKQYFADVSAGNLLYTNIVVGYVRIPRTLHPRSFYNDLDRDSSRPVNELIRDAIMVMTNQPGYMTEIVPQLEGLSTDETGNVLAANFLVAGADSGVWSKGLWPHMSNLYAVGPQELWPGGKKVDMYQMTTITFSGSALTIGVFCHETGHLLCGFPDIYDYDDSSAGGAGAYCLMSNQDSINPQHCCAYLKLAAGWAKVTDILPGPAKTFTLPAPGTNGNQLLRFRPWTFSREYYLLENRQKTGRDSQIPGGGILVWHIDELGDHNNENLLPNTIHANYEVTLVQADGRWNLHRGDNIGDTFDPFYSGNSASGYPKLFSDSTSPGATWWGGSRSGLVLRDFSLKGSQMTLVAEANRPAIVRDPLSQVLNVGDNLFLSIQMATNRNYSYAWTKGGLPLTNDLRISGVDSPMLSVQSVTLSDAGQYRVEVACEGYSETSRVAQVTIKSWRPLVSTDLGDAVRTAGSTLLLADSYAVTAAGSGLGAAADSCRFVYEKISGDFDARVQLAAISPEDGVSEMRARAGLMVRESLDAGSASAAILAEPYPFDPGFLLVLAREATANPSIEAGSIRGIPAFNNWMRAKREGNLVSLYYSTNGSRWEWINTVPLKLGTEAFVGMVASSCNPLTRSLTSFKSYSLQTNTPTTFSLSSTRNSVQEGSTNSAEVKLLSSRNGPIEINYTVSMPLANGIQFQALNGVFELPPGTNVGYLHLFPIDDTNAESPMLVSISVPSSGVIQSTANTIIFDDEQEAHGLKRESYTAISGIAVADLTTHPRYPGCATTIGTISQFEFSPPPNSGDVISGYLTPPFSGEYRFYLASANASELWLSLDSAPENAVLIAEEFAANSKRNWAGYGPTSHISAPIFLVQSNWYYVKTIHKAGAGPSHVAVAWQLPGGNAPASGSLPITSDYLACTLPANYSPSLNLRLKLSSSSTGRPMLRMDNPSQRELVIEVSNDLIYWESIHTNTVFENIDLLGLDQNYTNASRRFFRAVAH